jgi:transcriptional regulator with XRE-family HTH domain
MSGNEIDPADGANASGALRAVGESVRALRKARGHTLERVAELAGLSTGIISQIERGLANPSFTTLVQLAHALDVPVGRLFSTPGQLRSPVVRKAERRRLEGHGLRAEVDAVYELLTPDLNGALEITWVETQPGYDTSATPFRHNGEEAGIIISGRKNVYLDGVCHTLGPGDSIRYASTIPHWYTNPGDEVCQAIWVSTPPTW